jgi:hypothetical protein
MEQLDQSGIYIYKQMCLHYQPHSVDDLPAIINPDGSHGLYKEGELHRDGDYNLLTGMVRIILSAHPTNTKCRDEILLWTS